MDMKSKWLILMMDSKWFFKFGYLIGGAACFFDV